MVTPQLRAPAAGPACGPVEARCWAIVGSSAVPSGRRRGRYRPAPVHDRSRPVVAAERGRTYDAGAAGSSDRSGSPDGALLGGAAGDLGRSTNGDGPTIEHVTTALQTIAGELRELAGTEPAAAELRQLDDAFAALQRADAALAAVKARVVACARRSRVATAAGVHDTAAYVRGRLSVSAREAKRQTELARDLSGLDATSKALADGTISPEQAAAVGRAARNGRLGDPQTTEAELLPLAADATPEQLQQQIRRREQAADPDALRRDEERAFAQRRCSISRRLDGLWELHALLDPVTGEKVATGIHAHTTADPTGTSVERRRSPEQRMADGLRDLVTAALAAGAPTEGGVKPQISVVVPIEVLDPDARVVGVGDFGTTLSPQAVQRLMCDASVSRVITVGASQVLDVGRATREWNPAQRRAMRVRHGGCRGPDCDRPFAWTDIHHVRWWSRGGRTDRDNGLPLCDGCHRLVHEGGWTLAYDPVSGAATFTSPAGHVVTTMPRGEFA